MSASLPSLGYGLGLRSEYYQQILEQRPAVDWFEIISENYLVEGGKALYFLDAIGEHYPLVMHGVSLSIGGSHALDIDYLRQLKQLADEYELHVDPDAVVEEIGVGQQQRVDLGAADADEQYRKIAGAEAEAAQPSDAERYLRLLAGRAEGSR